MGTKRAAEGAAQPSSKPLKRAKEACPQPASGRGIPAAAKYCALPLQPGGLARSRWSASWGSESKVRLR